MVDGKFFVSFCFIESVTSLKVGDTSNVLHSVFIFHNSKFFVRIHNIKFSTMHQFFLFFL